MWGVSYLKEKAQNNNKANKLKLIKNHKDGFSDWKIFVLIIFGEIIQGFFPIGKEPDTFMLVHRT